MGIGGDGKKERRKRRRRRRRMVKMGASGKQTPKKSGLLLVTGPYKVNGVPLRRLNQAYVIATSTKVDISSLNVPEHIDDSYFARVPSANQEEAAKGAPVKVNEEWLEKRKADQKAVDEALLPIVEG